MSNTDQSQETERVCGSPNKSRYIVSLSSASCRYFVTPLFLIYYQLNYSTCYMYRKIEMREKLLTVFPSLESSLFEIVLPIAPLTSKTRGK